MAAACFELVVNRPYLIFGDVVMNVKPALLSGFRLPYKFDATISFVPP